MSLAKAHAAVRIEPTEGELRAAWQRCHKVAAGWPATFEAAMEHPTYSRLVQINARHPAITPTAIPTRHPWPFMAGRTHRMPAANQVPVEPMARVYDIKRAAAGDRDDD